MRHRLFVALNLPLSLQEEIFCLASRYPELPAKWTRKENLHITLQFLGNASEENIGRISESLKKIAQKHAPFHLTTEAVAYGPSRKNPRMIWITLEESPKLRNLWEDISSGLSKSGFSPEHSELTPHITLARINQMLFRQMDAEERASIEEELRLEFPVSSLDLMDSSLRPGGSEYEILESFQLQ